MLTDPDLTSFIVNSRWQDARPNPVVPPHQYTHRDWYDPAGFRLVVLHIREAGYPGTFRGVTYLYLDHGGFTYWTMGAPLEKTIILNRRPVEVTRG